MRMTPPNAATLRHTLTPPPWAFSTLLVSLILGGCANHAPQTGGNAPRPAPSSSDRDGPEANPPSNLMQQPDATPRLEAIRKGGPNKPYEVLGKRYDPLTDDTPLSERGLASWYGKKFHGKPTSSGELYNMYAMTAAHPTMPIPSYARVRNPANGREVIVRVNDRGPFHSNRVIDVSYTAALKLDILRGVTPVEVERITYEDIRTGAWQSRAATRLASAGAVDTAESTATLPLTSAALAAATLPLAPSATSARTAPLAQAANGPSEAVDSMSAGPGVGASTRIASGTVSAQAEAPLPPAPKAASPGFWIQLGAFRKLDGAETLRSQVSREQDWAAPLLAIFRDAGLHRLQAGPYASRSDAAQAADRLRIALALTPVIVERR